jgi:dihydrolipoamide dehydrogenase
VAKQLNQGVTHLMKKNKITVHMGDGALTAPGKLTVTDKDGKKTDLSAKHIIIATGARARDLPFAPADGKRVWTYRHAMVPAEMPSDLLVIGSGAIGIEFASFYNDMGSKVTVVEMMDRIVPVEDKDVSTFLEKSLAKQGMTILTGAGVEDLKADAKGVTAKIKTKDGKVAEHKFSHAIVAIGIVPNTENIGLEKLGVKAERGIIAVESNIPGCTYCHPQVASVGLTEAKAKEAGYTVKVGNFPFIGNGKAIALGEPEGFIKTVFDAKTGELLGAHMVGAEVTELIQGYTVGKQAELVEADFIKTVFAHPTLSEMMHESVLASEGRALHI